MIGFILRKQEHIYEVDENTGRCVRVHRTISNPLKNHHEDQVTKQTQHEKQLGNQHQKHTAYLPKVPTGGKKQTHTCIIVTESHNTGNNGGKKQAQLLTHS